MLECGAKDAGIFNECGKVIKLCLYKGVAGHAAATAIQLANPESNRLLYRYKHVVNNDTALTLSAY